MKKCTQCREEKDFSCFGPAQYKPGPGRYHYCCKQCCIERTRLAKLKNKEKNQGLNPYDETKFRKCSKCKVDKVKTPINFCKDISNTDGLNIYCNDCFQSRLNKFYQNNKSKVQKAQKEYLKNLSPEKQERLRLAKLKLSQGEKAKAKKKEYALKNREAIRQKDKIHRELNKEEIKKKKAEWLRNNRDWDNAANARKKASKLRATPKWVDAEHEKRIREIYAKCQELTKTTGIKYQVDHIIPLQGKEVCGLHVFWNIEPIPASENASKCNKLPASDKWRKLK